MVDKTSFRVYYIHTMKATILTALTLILTACSTSPVSFGTWDPRCQLRQYCPYTDPPPAIRTEALRSTQSQY